MSTALSSAGVHGGLSTVRVAVRLGRSGKVELE
jgi:hypothetical protein